uniref:Uncharacterized protein n=1 Tax=Anopheles merus TaxID=30066 RepID=A0A182V0K0_ANOME
MSRSVRPSVKSGLLHEPSSPSASPTSAGRRKSVALRAESFDEQQLLRVQQPSRPAGSTPGGSLSSSSVRPQSSPKFFRTQSFGDRLLASASPKFVKSKKMFHSIGQKSSSSTVLFYPPETPSAGAGSARQPESNSRAREPPAGHDPLGAYREELRQLRQLQKERFRSRSSSISIERWNESATGPSVSDRLSSAAGQKFTPTARQSMTFQSPSP